MLAGALSLFVRGRWVPRHGWKVLTSKQSSKIYKGKGAMQTGVKDKWARFHPVESMRPIYVVPSLAGCSLKPYVSRTTNIYKESASTTTPVSTSETQPQATQP